MSNPAAKSPPPPLSESIKALRKRMGLSTEQFGRLFFVSPRTVEDWEQGRREPRGLTRQAIAKKIGGKNVGEA